MTLLAEKLADVFTVISSFLCKCCATKKPELQWMAGKLNWACRVVYGGCTFLCRILDMMNSMSPSTKHRLTASFYRDISWWVNFTHFFMGTQIFLNQQPTVDVMTDAAGGYFRGNWFYFNFLVYNPAWSQVHINHEETLAIVLAAKC